MFTDIGYTRSLAELPADLAVTSSSWAFPLAALPIAAWAVTATGYLMWLACAAALVGVFTRPALVLATACALYFLAVTQHTGAVVHHHHLVWFLALLAATPCDDVLSLGATLRARRGAPRPPKRALSYGAGVWIARLLIGMIFVFPGIHKMAESGVAWALSDNLQNQMYWKWYQHGRLPSWRIDAYPAVVRGLAVAAVLFELGMLPLLLSKRARPFVAGTAFLFHMGTELWMFIRFVALWPTYVVLLDAHEAARGIGAELFAKKTVVEADAPTIAALRSADLLGRVIYREADNRRLNWVALGLRHPLALLILLAPATRRATSSPTTLVATSPSRTSLVMGAALCLGCIIAGATGTTQGWPFACYPTFEWMAGAEIPHLAIDAIDAKGHRVAIPTRPRSQKEWGIVWSAVGATHGPVSESRLRAYFDTLVTERRIAERAGAVRVRLYRAYSAVAPERWNEAPTRRILLLTLPVEPRPPIAHTAESPAPRAAP